MLNVLIGALAPLLGKVIDKAVPDEAAKAELAAELARLADAGAARDHAAMMGQVEVNKIEAAHASVFVAGWRPAIGWIGGFGLAMLYIVQPAVNLWNGRPVGVDTAELMVLLSGLLGFGGLRTFDKLKGTALPAKPIPTTPAVTQGATATAAVAPDPPRRRRWRL